MAKKTKPDYKNIDAFYCRHCRATLRKDVYFANHYARLKDFPVGSRWFVDGKSVKVKKAGCVHHIIVVGVFDKNLTKNCHILELFPARHEALNQTIRELKSSRHKAKQEIKKCDKMLECFEGMKEKLYEEAK